MSSRSPRPPDVPPIQSCTGGELPSIGSYDEIVEDYIKTYRPIDQAERENWVDHACLSDAIEIAALSTLKNGNRHPHQYRIPGEALQHAAAALVGIEFSDVHNFDDLHQIVDESIRSIKGIGELTVYDIAHRIGMSLDIAPEYVYLHRGTREGAHALGLTGDKLQVDQLPCALRTLTAAEIENSLCIYKANISQIENSR